MHLLHEFNHLFNSIYRVYDNIIFMWWGDEMIFASWLLNDWPLFIVWKDELNSDTLSLQKPNLFQMSSERELSVYFRSGGLLWMSTDGKNYLFKSNISNFKIPKNKLILCTKKPDLIDLVFLTSFKLLSCHLTTVRIPITSREDISAIRSFCKRNFRGI